jgi:hypothetical protein
VANSRWCNDVFGQQISNVTGSLPSDEVAPAQELDGMQDLWTTAKELLVDLDNEGEVRSMLV